jgi:hypothetical protein
MTRKLNRTIIFIIVLCVAAFAALVLTRPSPEQSPNETVVAGVAAGDAFTYSIRGYANIIDANATVPEWVFQVNMTEWYKVTITQVNDSEVSFSATWRFLNGTEIDRTGKVNIKTGIGNSQDFWAIYASGLEAGDHARPFGPAEQVINATEKRTYKSGERETNSILAETTFYTTDDPSITCNNYRSIYFDKQTGMLVELVNTELYSSPQLFLKLEWKLVDSTVWDVS